MPLNASPGQRCLKVRSPVPGAGSRSARNPRPRDREIEGVAAIVYDVEQGGDCNRVLYGLGGCPFPEYRAGILRRQVARPPRQDLQEGQGRPRPGRQLRSLEVFQGRLDRRPPQQPRRNRAVGPRAEDGLCYLLRRESDAEREGRDVVKGKANDGDGDRNTKTNSCASDWKGSRAKSCFERSNSLATSRRSVIAITAPPSRTLIPIKCRGRLWQQD
jgi:hypothetical protein